MPDAGSEAVALPVYYLNLDARPDRRLFMERQFDALGIRAERIPASTGGSAGGPLSRPELGCFESHIMAWRRLLEGSAPAAVVFEDDVCISMAMPGLLSALGAGHDWYDVLRFECRRRPMRLGRPLSVGLPAPLAARRQLSIAAGAAGYVVTRRAAEWYLNSPDLLREAVDAVMFKQPAIVELRIMQVVPAPVIPVELRRPDEPAATSDLEATRSRKQHDLVKGARRRVNAAAAAVRHFAPADLAAGLVPLKVRFHAPAADEHARAAGKMS